jgi:hypothetical protein
MTLSTSAVAVCLLQRFGEVVRALPQFLEKPSVFDRDDGLLGEIADQLDLLIGEWPHFLAVNGNDTD